MTDPARVVVLAVDAGTTAVKTTAFTADGTAVAGARRPAGQTAPRPGRAEQDPAAVVDAVLGSLREVVATLGTPTGGVRIAGIAVSTAMHGLCAIGADDRPLTPIITWADVRAASQAERLRAADPGLHDRTGTPVHPMAPLAKLVWFREQDPETFAAAARWVGVKELVLHALTGEWVLDESVASGTGLWASATRDWDPAALRAAGLAPDRLARLVPTTEVLDGLTDDAARATGLPRATPVVAGAGDGPLANLGIGAVDPGVAACSIGTSGALRLTVDRPTIDADRRLFAYALDAERWVTGGAVNNGGSVLHWTGEALAPDLGPHPEDELLAAAAAVPAGSEGLVMLPALNAERAPRWDATAQGAYVGLTARHGRGHLVRAAIEGATMQLALVLASLRAAGHDVHEVRATGGFARSPLWRQLLADVLDLPVAFPESTEGSGLGAAMVGFAALGLGAETHAPAVPPGRGAADGRADPVTASGPTARPDDRAETLLPDPAAAAVYAAVLPVFARLQDDLAPGLRALRSASGAG